MSLLHSAETFKAALQSAQSTLKWPGKGFPGHFKVLHSDHRHGFHIPAASEVLAGQQRQSGLNLALRG